MPAALFHAITLLFLFIGEPQNRLGVAEHDEQVALFKHIIAVDGGDVAVALFDGQNVHAVLGAGIDVDELFAEPSASRSRKWRGRCRVR